MKPSSAGRIELLRRWLRGETNRQEEAQLEAALRDDPWLAEAVEGFRQQPDADHEASLDRLRRRIKPSARRSGVRLWWRYAAAIALLLVALFVVYIWVPADPEPLTRAEAATTPEELPNPDLEALADSTPPPLAKLSEKESTTAALKPAKRKREPRPSALPPPPPMPRDTSTPLEAVEPTPLPAEPEADLADAVPIAEEAPPPDSLVSFSVSSPEPEEPSVTSFARSLRPTSQGVPPFRAQPVGGFELFNRKLQEGWNGEQGGVVLLRFFIDSTGQPTDFDVLESPDSIAASYVLEQLQNGKWTLPPGNVRPVPVEYRIRLPQQK